MDSALAAALEQIAAVIAAQHRLRDRFLFALLAETGMRVSQALGLRHEDMRTWERRVELVPREDNANGARGKGAQGFAIVSDQLVRLHALYMADESRSCLATRGILSCPARAARPRHQRVARLDGERLDPRMALVLRVDPTGHAFGALSSRV